MEEEGIVPHCIEGLSYVVDTYGNRLSLIPGCGDVLHKALKLESRGIATAESGLGRCQGGRYIVLQLFIEC